MSFLIDPPLLFLSGMFIYFGGRRLEWGRHAKIVVGLGIALVFIVFSSLLYTDAIRCVFPFFSNMTGSEFMFHTNLTGITKADVPLEVVVILFLLYPLWIFAGYAFALLSTKRLRTSKAVFTYSDVKSRKEKRDPSEYAVMRDENVGKCVAEAINSIGGIDRFVKNGDKVLIKVNICGGVPESKGSFTSTEVVEKLVELVRGAGGVPTVADADMIWTKFGPASKDTGWADWAKSKNVRLLNLIYTKIVRFDFGKESTLGLERVSKEMIDADVIISVPTMKTHLLTGVTLGMKNMYGTFPEIDKAKFHRAGIEEVIYYVNKAFTPNLVVIDGSIGGEAIGPLSCRPLSYKTIIASNDVVTADSVACKLMGYEPTKINHIKTARDRGLGEIPTEYKFDNLKDKPHIKDFNWERPDPDVKDFYEWAIEFVLKFPGWETLFNLGADFFLYDTARLPVIRYFTPAVLQLLNDSVYLALKGQKKTEADKKRRRVNASLVLLVAIASLLGFYLNGFFWMSPFFDVNYMVAIIVSLLVSLRMKTRHLATLVVAAGLVSFALERTITSGGVLVYQGKDPFLFVVPGWIILMIAILGISDLLRAWIEGLGIFKMLERWRVLPTVVIALVFAAFFIWEGYFNVGKSPVQLMYLAMIVLGLFYSSRCSIDWNAALAIVSVALGGYMELAGSLAGFWQYHFLETLPVFMTLAWALNSWAVHGISYLAGADLSDSMAAKLD